MCPSLEHRVRKTPGKLFCVNQKGNFRCSHDQVFNGKDECLNCWEAVMISKPKVELVCKLCPTCSTSSAKLARKSTSCGDGYPKETDFRGEHICNWGRLVNDEGDWERCRKGYTTDVVDINTCI